MPETTVRITSATGFVLAHLSLACLGFMLAMAHRGNLFGEASVGGIVAGHIVLLAVLGGMSRLSITRRCAVLILGAVYLSALLITVAGVWSSRLGSLQFTIVAVVPLAVLTVASFLLSLFYAEILPPREIPTLNCGKHPFQFSLMGILAFTTFVAILLGLGHAIHHYVATWGIAFVCVAALIHATCGVGSLYLLLWAGMTDVSALKRCAFVVVLSPILGSVYPALLPGATYRHYIFWNTVYFVAFLLILASLVSLRGMGFSVAFSERAQPAAHAVSASSAST